jgi:hypothetical protein
MIRQSRDDGIGGGHDAAETCREPPRVESSAAPRPFRRAVLQGHITRRHLAYASLVVDAARADVV